MVCSGNYAFIDSQNVNLAILDQGWKLDFGRFRVHLADKYHVTKALLFIGYVSRNKKLYAYLQKQKYVLIFKPTLGLPEGKVKGNVDSELVLHAMIEYQNYNKAIIVTGDGDFYCLVDYLYRNNKLERLLVPNVRKYSKLLIPFAVNKIDFMNNLKDKLEYRAEQKERQLHKD